jgi:hypothetical protein
MAVIAPKGTAATVMRSVISAVPTMAGKIPPVVIPSFGNSEMKSQVSVFHPPAKVMMRMEAITKRINKTLTPVRLLTMISLVFLFISGGYLP